jgi:RES domain
MNATFFPSELAFIEALKKIPTEVDLFKSKLKHVSEEVKNLSDLKDISNLYDENILLLPTLHFNMPPKIVNIPKAYRVRYIADLEKNDINLVQTYSYPNPFFCSTNGRANVKKKPVFYCAFDQMTAIMEAKPKLNDIGYMSIWTISSDRDCHYTTFLSPSISTENRWNEAAINSFKQAAKASKQYGMDKEEQLKLV